MHPDNRGRGRCVVVPVRPKSKSPVVQVRVARFVRAPAAKLRSTRSPRALAARPGHLHRGNASALREKTSSDPPAARRWRQETQLLVKCPEKYPALSTPHPSSGNKSDTVAVNFAQPLNNGKQRIYPVQAAPIRDGSAEVVETPSRQIAS